MRLRVATFEEVEHDASATAQAAAVVVLASLSRGVGWFYWIGGVSGIVRGTIVAMIGWAIDAALLWIIGTRVLPTKSTEADWGQLARTVGFAQAPGVFAVVALVPGAWGWLAALAVALWVLTATIIAARQALDYTETFRAVLVCVLAWLAEEVFFLVVGLAGVPGFGGRVLY